MTTPDFEQLFLIHFNTSALESSYYESVIKCMKEAYNHAVDKCAETAVLCVGTEVKDNTTYPKITVDKQSILKNKIK